jgi:cysteine desulfurase
MGAGDEVANVSIRFSLGRFNTEEEIDYAIKSVIEVLRKAREISPLYENATKQKEKT